MSAAKSAALGIHWLVILATAFVLAAAGALRAKMDLPSDLKTYNPPGFYVLHSDVPRPMLQQIWLRMNFAAGAYQRRLHAIFGGAVTAKQPFYIFKSYPEYYAAGGWPGSAGEFRVGYSGQRLMAMAGQKITHQVWHIIQHEGFHQFTFAFLGRMLPPWANEGTAEYFGEGLFTGNSFVTGWIPPYREKLIQWEIRHHKFLSIHKMRLMPYSQWNDVLMGTNYDEAWSMIYFLAWANHHKYAGPFTRYLRMFQQGVSSSLAWARVFGTNDADFEKLWKRYWLSLPPNATAELYARVQTQTLTNYLARSWSLNQKFKTATDFLHAAADGTLKQYVLPNRYWLPPSLLARALAQDPQVGTWTLTPTRVPRLICTMSTGTKIIGIFHASRQWVGRVHVRVVRAAHHYSGHGDSQMNAAIKALNANAYLDTVAQ